MELRDEIEKLNATIMDCSANLASLPIEIAGIRGEQSQAVEEHNRASFTGDYDSVAMWQRIIARHGKRIADAEERLKHYARVKAECELKKTELASAAAEGWTCFRGHTGNTGKFCSECGSPAPTASWTCSRGHTGNTGKFCTECGSPAPTTSWTCSCGHTGNKGKFCIECGKPRP